MDAAIVTGASSGIGLAVSQKLCEMGYEVFGIGRDFGLLPRGAAAESPEGTMHAVVCDLLDTEKLLGIVQKIQKERRVRILVNNAGTAYYGLHEELNPQKIRQMVRTNLEAPMILTQQLLRALKQNQGYVVNIASVTANHENPRGCAYGATKAGLASFSRSLFEEARKYGVKVAAIYPDMTRTNLYRNADFCEGEDERSYLNPQEVADAVEYIVSARDGLAVTELALRPQIRRIQKKAQRPSGDGIIQKNG